MVKKSSQSFIEAKRYVAKGFNSPFRNFDSVGGVPIFMERGGGSKLFDVDGNKYIDYSLAWGPMILGHSNKRVRSVIKKTAKLGWCFGTPTIAETVFASKITKIFPSMDKVRLTNSGTEAVMAAIRLARGYTNKEKIIIFEGHYHGHGNDTLVKIQGGRKILSSTGITSGVLSTTLVARFNDVNSVEELLKNNDVAAIVVEPVATNMGVVLPKDGFLNQLRFLCDKYQALLVFDEVVTGLRVSLGGAQSFYNVVPDITILGKVLAGGMPVGAFGGRDEIMDILSPLGNVYTAGTFSGNPMTVNCGIVTIDELSKPNVFQKLTDNTEFLCNELRGFVSKNNLPVVINNAGSIFSVFFTEGKEVSSLSDVKKCDFNKFSRFFNYLLEKGVYLSPSGEDSSFLSTEHSVRDIKKTIGLIKSFFDYDKGI